MEPFRQMMLLLIAFGGKMGTRIQEVFGAAFAGIATQDWGTDQEEVEIFLVDACMHLNRLDMLADMLVAFGGDGRLRYAMEYIDEMGLVLPHASACDCATCATAREAAIAEAETAADDLVADEAARRGPKTSHPTDCRCEFCTAPSDDEHHDPGNPDCGCPDCCAGG